MAPFSSQSQARFMFSQHPGIARRFAKETPDISALPERKKKSKKAALLALLKKKR